MRRALLDRAAAACGLAQQVAEDGTVNVVASNGMVVSLSVPFDEASLMGLLVEAGHKGEALAQLERVNDELRKRLEARTLALPDGAAAGRVAKADALEAQEKALAAALREARREPASEERDAAVAALRGELAETRRRFFAALAGIEAEHPEYALLVRFRSLDLAAVQKHLPADAALLEFFPSERALYIFVVTADAFAVEDVRSTVAHGLRQSGVPTGPDQTQMRGAS